MGKGIGVFGNFTGKVSNVVGYIIKNNGTAVQGLRAYQPQVQNPQTNAQISQRIVLTPVQNIYGALKPIIDRGFQDAKYGNDSRLKFLSLNMKDFAGPFLTKGSKLPVPGPFVLTDGSLMEHSITEIVPSGGSAVEHLTTDIAVGSLPSPVFSHNFWQSVLTANPDLNNGDQLTIVECFTYNGGYFFRYDSIQIDTTDYNDPGTIYTNDGLYEIKTEANKPLAFTRAAFNPNHVPVAAAIIVSRESASGLHMRSRSRFAIDYTAIGDFFSAQALATAKQSYLAATRSSDWPEEEFDGDNTVRYLTAQPVTAAMTSTEQAVGKFNALGYFTPDGHLGLFYKTDGNKMLLIDENGRTHAYTDSEGTVQAELKDSWPISKEYNSGYGTL